MTARLDKLQKAGHIERCPHPEDRRALLVCLTESGLKMIRDFMPGYVDMQAKALSGLSNSERDLLAALLKKLIQTADRKPE
jgi:DNA-binding MarR family transcriptional regulator